MNTNTPPTGSGTLYIADNYDLLRQMPSESVNLICTDPPFKKNDTLIGGLRIPLTNKEVSEERRLLSEWGINTPQEAEKVGIVWPTGETTANFKDIWSWEDDVHEVWVQDIEEQHPAIAQAVKTARRAHSESMAAYMVYMAVRLIECYRVLTPTGSIFLHCDHSANSYLRVLFDAIFGHKGFRNQIVWCYTGPGNVTRFFKRKHDTILFYAKSKDSYFNVDAVKIPYSEETLARRGRVEGASSIISASVETEGRRSAEMVEQLFGHGKLPEDWWTGISPLTNQAERTGYPTQKPVALAERIIRAASAPDDVVFDPFAGCAYVPVASERLGRQWIACDLSIRAFTVLRRQFAKFTQQTITGADEQLDSSKVIVYGPTQLPTRQRAEKQVEGIKPLPARKYKTPASIFSREEMLTWLLSLSDWKAWCCGFANWTTDEQGNPTIEHTIRNFELDHLDPQSREGSHEIVNRVPMCPYHNSKKRDRRVHLDDFRLEVEANGELAVSDISELVNLTEARDKTLTFFAQEKARRNGLQLPGIG